MPKPKIVPVEEVERAIVVLRGQRVMLDTALAALYGVDTRVLVQAVRRNLQRFPADFVFHLTWEEARRLRSQSVILDAETTETTSEILRARLARSNLGRGQYRKYAPYAFTEQGIAMLSSVLRSPRAVQVNVEIMRTFVRLRQWLQGNAELTRKLEALEEKYDGQFKVVFDAIRELTTPPASPKKRIGFETDGE